MMALLGAPDLGWLPWALIALAAIADAAILYIGLHFTEHYRRPRWERRARLAAERENSRLRQQVRDERLKAQDAARFAERELERATRGRR